MPDLGGGLQAPRLAVGPVQGRTGHQVMTAAEPPDLHADDVDDVIPLVADGPEPVGATGGIENPGRNLDAAEAFEVVVVVVAGLVVAFVPVPRVVHP